MNGIALTPMRGTAIKNIRLTDIDKEIECHAVKVKDPVLQTNFSTDAWLTFNSDPLSGTDR